MMIQAKRFPVLVARRAPILVVAAVFTAGGCAAQQTSITGDGVKQAQVIRGDVGITGEDHELTILAGSDVSKLSIWGDEIKVRIEDGAVVRKIEIIGEDNTIYCPKGLSVEYSAIGEDNKLKHHRTE